VRVACTTTRTDAFQAEVKNTTASIVGRARVKSCPYRPQVEGERHDCADQSERYILASKRDRSLTQAARADIKCKTAQPLRLVCRPGSQRKNEGHMQSCVALRAYLFMFILVDCSPCAVAALSHYFGFASSNMFLTTLSVCLLVRSLHTIPTAVMRCVRNLSNR
jgi:hypothetical protein